MNRSININYYDGYIEIIKPDNTKIRLNQEEITMNDVADDRPLETTSVTATTISNIYDVTNENYIANFSYEGIYFRFIFGPAGAGIMADDCGTYMAMSSAVSPYHTSHYIDYEVISDNNNFPSIPSIDLKSWYLCAVKDYTTSEKTNWQYSYSYNIETNSRTGTAVSANNMVTKTTSNITSYLEEVYERNNNEDVLKKSTLHEFKERHKERPTNITTKTYNSNGNYITKENSYTYNDYGKVLTETLTVENNVKKVM